MAPVILHGRGITVAVRNRTSAEESNVRIQDEDLLSRQKKIHAMQRTAAITVIVKGKIPAPRKAVDTRVAVSRRKISILFP